MNITISMVLGFIIIVWIFIYTVSYAVWTWKDNNKAGAIALFIVSLTGLLLPAYAMFFRT